MNMDKYLRITRTTRRIICMMVLLVCMGLQMANASVTINKTNFPDDAFRAILMKTYPSGTITDNQLKVVTKIVVKDRGIASLKGIEFFYNLNYLSCSKNELTRLDVSQNRRLDSLYCYENKLTNIILPDNNSIRLFSCYGNNLEHLDLSECPDLERLFCYENQLQTLDIHYCPKLIQLNCSSNSLEEIEGLPECSNLQILKCHDNQLTELNIAFNTAMKVLYCNNNNLATLDISDMENLQDLGCYGNTIEELDLRKCQNLKILGCRNNLIRTLDIHNCLNLEQLYCRQNQLTSLDLNNSPSLRKYEVYGQALVSIFHKTDYGYYVEMPDGFEANRAYDYKVVNWDGTPIACEVQASNNMLRLNCAAPPAGITYQYNVHNRTSKEIKMDVSIYSAVPISEEIFPDPVFRNLINGTFGGDGYLTDDEIFDTVDMDLSYNNIHQTISSLKGIEYFYALRRLRCSGQGLTRLDLTKNKKLVILDCSHNQLERISFAPDGELSKVDLSVNQLKTMGFSLVDLPCHTHASNIETVGANYEIRLQDADYEEQEQNTCNENILDMLRRMGWTPLHSDREHGNGWHPWVLMDDVPIDYEHFPDETLRNLMQDRYGDVFTAADAEEITELNLSWPEDPEAQQDAEAQGLKPISDLTGITHFKALKSLKVDNSKLGGVEISCPGLKELSLRNSNVYKLSLSPTCALNSVDCSGNRLENVQFQKTEKYGNQGLIFLDVSNNKITSIEMELLIDALPNNSGSGYDSELIFVDNSVDSEQNTFLEKEIRRARAKGWTCYYRSGDSYYEYYLSDEDAPTAITHSVCDVVHPHQPAYNLQGQRVGNGYRGIVIKNGHKVLIK